MENKVFENLRDAVTYACQMKEEYYYSTVYINFNLNNPYYYHVTKDHRDTCEDAYSIDYNVELPTGRQYLDEQEIYDAIKDRYSYEFAEAFNE